MKKLMIAAAIVCAVAMSQAASIAWSISDDVATTEGGYTVYVVSALSQFANVAAIEAAAVEAESGNFSAVIEPGFRGGEFASGALSNSAWETIDSVDFYYVVVKGTEGYWTSEKQTALVAKKTATPETSMYTTLGTLASGQMTSFGVPEPTSGLLLLLGMGALALRRKQA